ncbi:hypothetical protein BJV77DRAFT_328121 [Russula vinacea]|nr:hypothetical protein BJV77DRAFT_328121 [Russula vinacea]
MPPLTRLTLSLLAATATILTVYSYFSGKSTDDDEPGSSSASSSDPATDASYPAQQTSARVGQTTVRTPTVADHDSGMCRPGLTSSDFTESHVLHPASPYTPSSHSYQRAPSPDDTHVHVSRLTVSPKEHSRTQSFSSDSDDYLGSSSRTWAAPRSWSPLPDVVSDPGADDTVSKAERNKKARELRDTESHVLHPASPYALSSHSYQRAPSPDDTHVHVSRLTVSPKEHSRTQSFSSDSDDYLGPSSHTWAAPRSWSFLPDVVSDPGADDVISKAERNKKPRELRDTESHVLHPASPYALSSHSYQRAPSTHDTHVHVSRLTVSPKEHPRTQSFSSDSDDYLGPSSHTWAAPRSWSSLPDVVSDPGADDVISKAERNKKARELRENARRSKREMIDARDRAKSARWRGDWVAESEHKQEAREHESEMKDLNKSAAKIIFGLKNQGRKEGMVDLHGLHVAEAVEYAKLELQSATYRNDDTVSFIVGKGLHAENGVSKLRPALEELFDERELSYSLDPRNSGKLIVYLKWS